MTFSALLGYPNDTLEPTLDLVRLNRANEIASKLANIDTLLANALPDSMATTVGDLKVDYVSHIQALKTEGSRLLHELAVVVSLPLKYDRYSGQSYDLVAANSTRFIRSLL